MEYNVEQLTVIDKVFDYSNCLPTVENITYLIKYLEQIYNQFLQAIKEDEEKNERLKYEFKKYNYKRNFGERFEISINEKSYNTIRCTTTESFTKTVDEGKVKNLRSLEIQLDLDYSRGNYDDLKKHDNSFIITFKPYEITFQRKSNYNENNMEVIEKEINEILKQFPTAETIFFSK